MALRPGATGPDLPTLDHRVGTRARGQRVDFGQEFGLPGHQLFAIQTTLSDIRDLLERQNAILVEAFETLGE